VIIGAIVAINKQTSEAPQPPQVIGIGDKGGIGVGTIQGEALGIGSAGGVGVNYGTITYSLLPKQIPSDASKEIRPLPQQNSQSNTFDADPGEMMAALDASAGVVNLAWTGVGKIAEVEQYMIREVDSKRILRHKAINNSVKFNAYDGDRFNVVDDKGRYLQLSPEMQVSNHNILKLAGIRIDCRTHKDCSLQVVVDVHLTGRSKGRSLATLEQSRFTTTGAGICGRTARWL
jgi:hypothetical protein